jgi:hypothetical protein
MKESSIEIFYHKPRRGKIQCSFETQRPLSHYQASPFFCHGRWEDIDQVTTWVIPRTRRLIRFMDATQAQPTKAWRRVFGSYQVPDGCDHTLVWRIGRHYFVSTEPYNPCQVDRLLANAEWRSVLLPRGVGIWNPPSTFLVLLSKDPAVSLEELKNRLVLAMPPA